MGWKCRLLGTLWAALHAGACQLWVGEYVADREDAVDTTGLCELEQRGFEFELDLQGAAAHETLEDYYIEANPELAERFTQVITDYNGQVSSRAATYVVGEAGIGKSFVMRRLVDVFETSDTCDVSLADALAAPSERLPTEKLPDLATREGDVVLSRLPGFVNPDAFSLAEFLEDRKCVRDEAVLPLILLDGIDEIHPSSARVLLRGVEQYLSAGGPFVHIVISGRPEGFAPWFSDPARGETTGQVTRSYHLQAPVYSTRGDIEFRLREYLAFAMQLDAVEQAEELDEYAESVVSAVERYPFLRYSLGNLAVGNVVLQHTTPGKNETERSLKDKIFADLLVRNVGTHDRPGSGSRFDAGYASMLERIAATHLDVNSKGEFAVSPTEDVTLVDAAGQEVGDVLVTQVLERSGLAYLASPTSTTKRFKFSPFWIQGYLAERYNEHVTPKYRFRGCD
jgi:hypothetical protein